MTGCYFCCPDTGRKEFMNRKKDLKLIRDWMPCMVNGCQVDLYFSTAYDTAPAETNTETVEQTLIAAYKSNRQPEK